MLLLEHLAVLSWECLSIHGEVPSANDSKNKLQRLAGANRRVEPNLRRMPQEAFLRRERGGGRCYTEGGLVWAQEKERADAERLLCEEVRW